MEVSLSDLRGILCGVHNDGTDGAVPDCSLVVGKSYLIRGVTFYWVGELRSVTRTDLVLRRASWIPSTGRFSDCLRTGEFDEVEPFINDAIISRSCMVDVTFWPHKLPREAK